MNQRIEPIAVVSISGGKDSTATALRAIEAYGRDRCRFVHADTGHEHELTEAYVRDCLPKALGVHIDIVKADFAPEIARKRRYVEKKWPDKGVPQEIVERALAVLHPTGIPFLDLCLWKGRFPSRMAQFCTQELKRYPLERYMIDLMSSIKEPVESWQGVRRDESHNRRDALAVERTPEGWTIVRPIVEWTAQQTVDYVLSHGVKLNPLYSQGCSRVGCMLCVNANKAEIANAARRWPHHVQRIRDWEALVSQASKLGYATLLHHADCGGGDDASAYDMSRIDAMVDWAKTTRGGDQYDLLLSGPPAMCSSSYGLCE